MRQRGNSVIVHMKWHSGRKTAQIEDIWQIDQWVVGIKWTLSCVWESFLPLFHFALCSVDLVYVLIHVPTLSVPDAAIIRYISVWEIVC